MLLLFSLLALGARAADKCYGIKLMDHYKCQLNGEDKGMCDKDKACMFGADPVEKGIEEYVACEMSPGKKCETTSDCNQECSTGQMCLDMGFMKGCAACADMGVKEDCDAGAKAGLMCVWSPGEGDDGMCIAGDDACMGMKKGACKKADDCEYKAKKCMRNYEPMCNGNRVDVHHKCHGKKTKEECASVKQPPFMKALCTWGKNTNDMEEGVMKCLKENGISSPTKCETNDDCICGQQCYEMFGMKSCSSCRDMGIEEDCDAMTQDSELACKFVGGEDDGLCIQVDPCREFSLDENQCKTEMNKTCQFKDDKCFMMKADKKSCKGRGKDKGAEMAARGMECEALKGCKWSQKGKGEKVKGKCKLGKKN